MGIPEEFCVFWTVTGQICLHKPSKMKQRGNAGLHRKKALIYVFKMAGQSRVFITGEGGDIGGADALPITKC